MPLVNQVAKVRTYFELGDKRLKMACSEGSTDSSGDVVIDMKIPGTDPALLSRFIRDARIWFDDPEPGDKIISVVIIDIDAIVYPANTIVGSYTDDEVPSANQGWFMSSEKSIVEALTGFGELPEAFYLRLVAKKGSAVLGKKIRINLHWAKAE